MIHIWLDARIVARNRAMGRVNTRTDGNVNATNLNGQQITVDGTKLEELLKRLEATGLLNMKS